MAAVLGQNFTESTPDTRKEIADAANFSANATPTTLPLQHFLARCNEVRSAFFSQPTRRLRMPRLLAGDLRVEDGSFRLFLLRVPADCVPLDA